MRRLTAIGDNNIINVKSNATVGMMSIDNIIYKSGFKYSSQKVVVSPDTKLSIRQ